MSQKLLLRERCKDAIFDQEELGTCKTFTTLEYSETLEFSRAISTRFETLECDSAKLMTQTIFGLLLFAILTGCASIGETKIPNIKPDENLIDGISFDAGAFANDAAEAAGHVFYIKPKVRSVPPDCRGNGSYILEAYKQLRKKSCNLNTQRNPVIRYESLVNEDWDGGVTALFGNVKLGKDSKAEVTLADLQSTLLSEECVDYEAIRQVPDDPEACQIIYAKGIILSSLSIKTYALTNASGEIAGPLLHSGGKYYVASSSSRLNKMFRVNPYIDVRKIIGLSKQSLCQKLESTKINSIEQFCSSTEQKIVPSEVYTAAFERGFFRLNETEIETVRKMIPTLEIINRSPPSWD